MMIWRRKSRAELHKIKLIEAMMKAEGTDKLMLLDQIKMEEERK